MSQDDPVRQQSGGGAPDARRRSLLARRLDAFWSVPVYRFAVLFLGFLVGIGLFYTGLRFHFGSHFRVLETGTAQAVYGLMSLFSSEVKMTSDTIIFYGPFPIEVIDECSGIYEALLLGAALLAYPTSWYKTLLGFAMGFPLIYAMNIARMALLLVVGRYFPHFFDFLHLYFWQGTMILMVASVWLLWVLWIVRGEGGLSGTRGTAP
jgi:archaeosortase B (VPXXXP-CTERM-specific)